MAEAAGQMLEQAPPPTRRSTHVGPRTARRDRGSSAHAEINRRRSRRWGR